MRISIVKVKDYIILGLELLLLSLGLGKGFGVRLGLVTLGLGFGVGVGVGLGVGLDIYKTIFIVIATAFVAQWRSYWTPNLEIGGSIPAQVNIYFFFINN